MPANILSANMAVQASTQGRAWLGSAKRRRFATRTTNRLAARPHGKPPLHQTFACQTERFQRGASCVKFWTFDTAGLRFCLLAILGIRCHRVNFILLHHVCPVYHVRTHLASTMPPAVPNPMTVQIEESCRNQLQCKLESARLIHYI